MGRSLTGPDTPLAVLASARARLRPFTADDLTVVRELMTDPEVMRFTGYGEPQPEERIAAELARWCGTVQAPLGVWCVEARETREFLGWCMLRPGGTGDPELGFMFPRAQWGKGYATEVSATLLEHAFSALGLRRVTASVDRRNTASIRVLHKLGMQQFGAATDDGALLHFEITADRAALRPDA